MDPYEGLPAVHDNEFVGLHIVRTPLTLSIVLEMRDHRTGVPVRVCFPDVRWLSANLLGCLVHGESAVDYIQKIPLDEIPPQYVINDTPAFEVVLISGSSFRLVSEPPETS
jgi:hypothetical protein